MKAVLLFFLIGWTSLTLADEAAEVAKIRAWYNAIQEGPISKTTKIPFQAAEESLGGDVTIRDYKDGLKAITISYSAGDHGSSDEHFYYRNDVLFFAFLQQQHWSFTDEVDAQGNTITKDTLVEQRIFLADGDFFRILRRKVTAKSTENLKKLIAEIPQKKVEAGDGTAEYIQRGKRIMNAKNAADVLKAFGPHYVPEK